MKITRKVFDKWISEYSLNEGPFFISRSQARSRFILKRSKSLGWYVYDKEDNEYSYRTWNCGGELVMPAWIKERSFKRRENIGLPKPRRKRTILPDSMFSLDELELASQVMEEMQ